MYQRATGRLTQCSAGQSLPRAIGDRCPSGRGVAGVRREDTVPVIAVLHEYVDELLEGTLNTINRAASLVRHDQSVGCRCHEDVLNLGR